jgi:hypothetical protein
MFASCLPAASESVLKSGPGSYLVITTWSGKRSRAIAGHRFRGINLNPAGEELLP